ncbi:MAG TPA: hypothetical protein VMU66_01745, partial [Gaiellales bacterium]|nr:hypothetical protein [Gaiellales bacterium]
MNRPTSVYLASITGSFWLVLAGLLVVDRGQIAGGWHAWLPLLGVAMIAEAFEVVTGDGAGDSVMSFSGGAHVAAVILFGPVIAAVIAASAVVLVDGVRAPSPRMVAANAALFGWASLVAGVAYQLAGGTVGSVSVASAVALVVLVVTRGLVNITVFSVGEALASETSPWLAVRGTLADGAVTYAGEGGL